MGSRGWQYIFPASTSSAIPWLLRLVTRSSRSVPSRFARWIVAEVSTPFCVQYLSPLPILKRHLGSRPRNPTRSRTLDGPRPIPSISDNFLLSDFNLTSADNTYAFCRRNPSPSKARKLRQNMSDKLRTSINCSCLAPNCYLPHCSPSVPCTLDSWVARAAGVRLPRDKIERDAARRGARAGHEILNLTPQPRCSDDAAAKYDES